MFADETADGNVLWLLGDHQGSIRDVADYDPVTNATTVAEHRTYSSFGRITSVTDENGVTITDPALLRHVELASVYAYTGREWESFEELYYYRARWYAADAGHFITNDPIGFAAGDTNTYRYVGNSATNFTDPDGRERVPVYDDAPTPGNPDGQRLGEATPPGFFGSLLLGAMSTDFQTIGQIYGDQVERNGRFQSLSDVLERIGESDYARDGESWDEWFARKGKAGVSTIEGLQNRGKNQGDCTLSHAPSSTLSR